MGLPLKVRQCRRALNRYLSDEYATCRRRQAGHEGPGLRTCARRSECWPFSAVSVRQHRETPRSCRRDGVLVGRHGDAVENEARRRRRE